MATMAAAIMLATGALAQDGSPPAPGAPIMLAPPKPLAPRPDRPADNRPGAARQVLPQKSPSMDAAPSRSATTKTQGIRVDTLGELDSNSVGVLDASSGGFGIDMWDGSSAGTVKRLLAQIRQPAKLPTARALARRLLLSAARPPRANAASKPRASAPPSLLARRIKLLLDLGDVESAKALLRIVPVRVSERAVGQARLNTALLMNDSSGACAEARVGVVKYDGVPWRKVKVFCQYLAGERTRAAIGAELLREQGIADDAYFALAAMLGGDTEVSFTVPAKLEPLHLAMMRAARVQISDTLVDGADVAALRAITFSPNAGLDTRLAAAERAEAAGALTPRSLRQIYGAVTFAPGELTTALTDADALNGPRGRALLYNAARAQKVPAAQAEVLAKAFTLARAQGRMATVVRAFLPVLQDIRPTEDLAWFAPEAARAFYFVGRLDLAGQWASLAVRAAPGRGAPDSGTAVLPNSMPATATPGSSPPSAEPPAEVRLWPFMAIAAAGAAAERRESAAMPAPNAATDTNAAQGPNWVLPPGSVAAPAESPTAADALAGARSVERPAGLGVMTGPGRLTGTPVTRETLPATDKAPSRTALDRAMFARWRKAQSATGERTAFGRGALVLTLLDALGVAVPASAWLKTVGPVREFGAQPQPGLVAALRSGAKEGRLGETVLLALAVLGADTTEKLHPSVIGPVVRALVGIGLVDEARALALEAAFEVGL